MPDNPKGSYNFFEEKIINTPQEVVKLAIFVFN